MLGMVYKVHKYFPFFLMISQQNILGNVNRSIFWSVPELWKNIYDSTNAPKSEHNKNKELKNKTTSTYVYINFPSIITSKTLRQSLLKLPKLRW